MKHYFLTSILAVTVGFCYGQTGKSEQFSINKAKLHDKIKGGWAGQTVGVTFGGPYEFRFLGTFIDDYQPLLWYDGYLKKTMLEWPGLYDDLYMDLTFVDVFEKRGFDAPQAEFASAYSNAGYALWHANQVGRYNVLNGIQAPKSGHWLNNPHADCIDYQIESDFAGLMSPGMPNTASTISDKIGHIMNYGDGWYGGVFVGAMYAVAFTSDDIKHVISEALKTVPERSEFYQCIADVIAWHKKYPTDWKQTWFEVQRKWAADIGCPDGVFLPFNIDAKVNAAYVVIGLLYGEGDFTRSLEISTRCGQDADCNPSTVGGVLGTILGYDKIPTYWKMGLAEAEDIDFKYTTVSLKDVYDIGLKHALSTIKRNGGSEKNDVVTIKTQAPVPVKFEQSFVGHFPIRKIPASFSKEYELTFNFEGTGFVIRGESGHSESHSKDEGTVFNGELYIDDALVENIKLPMSFRTRRADLAWKYELKKGNHTVRYRILNPTAELKVNLRDVIIYSDKPVNGFEANQVVK